MQGKDLRIVFMGTPDFAVAGLKALVDGGYNVVGVITAPDKPAGRGKKLNESAVKKYAVDESQRLSKTGFKFKDFTNSEQNIMNMMVEDKIYMISPEKPKSLVKELKSRNGKLTAKIVELHRRGKRVRELK